MAPRRSSEGELTMFRISLVVVFFCCALGITASLYFGTPRFDLAINALQEQKPAPPTARPAEKPVRVSVASVRKEDVPIYLSAIGTVQAYNTVTVKTRVDGEVVKILFEEGQDVKSGDVLVIIDQRPLVAQLHQQEAALLKDKAQLEGAILDLQRYETLVLKKNVTQQQVDQQRALVEQYRAQVQSDEAQVEYAKTQLEYTTIRAPISGRTGIRLIDEGNIVHANDNTGFVVLTQLNPISVVFTLASSLVAQARMTLGRARAPVITYGADFTTELDRGTVELVDNQVDQTTGTIKLKASFPNKDLRLWPGNFANGRIVVDTRSQGLTIPSAAVRHGPRGDYVWVVRANKTVEFRRVDIGQNANERNLITRGLSVGEQVVTEGHFLLENGRSVEIINAEPVAPAARRPAAQVTAEEPG
jgi:membrane fusion protein, multidrug efflux system